MKGHGPVGERRVPWVWKKLEEAWGLVTLMSVAGVAVTLGGAGAWPLKVSLSAVLLALPLALGVVVRENARQIPRRFQPFAEPEDENDEGDAPAN